MATRVFHGIQLFPNRQILDQNSLQMTISKSLKNGMKISKQEENVGKGAQAISLFLPAVFSKDLYYRHVKPGLDWEKVKAF